jgi:hypothetical protein
VQNTKKLGELLLQLCISINYASVIKRAGNKIALRVKIKMPQQTNKFVAASKLNITVT